MEMGGDQTVSTDVGSTGRLAAGADLPCLPEELLCLVTKDLDDYDIAACELVSASWNKSFGRPLVVRDCIARSFTGLLHHVDTQAVPDDMMRKLYRAARRNAALRKRGQFYSSMAHYPFRKGESAFTSKEALPPPRYSYAQKMDMDTGKIFRQQCIPTYETAKYHCGCLAWSLSNQFTVIDDLSNMSREIIEWPGHEELVQWDKDNPNPNRYLRIDIVGFTEDLLVFYDTRQLPARHMMVYHRHLKQWRTVKLPEVWIEWQARFFAKGTTIVFRSIVKEGELPIIPHPRCGMGLRAMLGRRSPVRMSLHQWRWEDGEEADFKPLPSAEAAPEASPTIVTQLGAVFHPTTPAIVFAVTITLSHSARRNPPRTSSLDMEEFGDNSEDDSGEARTMVYSTAIKYRDGVRTSTVIECTSTLPISPEEYVFNVLEDTQFPFSPSNGQGEHVVAVIHHHGNPSLQQHWQQHQRKIRVSTTFFNPITERFSHASTPDLYTIWPDLNAPPNIEWRSVKGYVWAGLLHYHMPMHTGMLPRRPKDAVRKDAFLRFFDIHSSSAKDARQGRRYLPVSFLDKWDLDSQAPSYMQGDDDFLIMWHREGYVIWRFDEKDAGAESGWQSWDELRPLVEVARTRVEDC